MLDLVDLAQDLDPTCPKGHALIATEGAFTVMVCPVCLTPDQIGAQITRVFLDWLRQQPEYDGIVLAKCIIQPVALGNADDPGLPPISLTPFPLGLWQVEVLDANPDSDRVLVAFVARYRTTSTQPEWVVIPDDFEHCDLCGSFLRDGACLNGC